jgi:hypothetical protein
LAEVCGRLRGGPPVRMRGLIGEEEEHGLGSANLLRAGGGCR